MISMLFFNKRNAHKYKTIIHSKSGIFCNDKKKIISDEDECKGIYSYCFPDPRGIRGEECRKLKVCKFCEDQREDIIWEIPEEIQKYFPINK